MEWLIAGLGNTGGKYDGTRHNLGIEAVRAWAGEKGAAWKSNGRCHAEIAAVTEADTVCVFPLLFMNESGGPVKCIADYYGVASDRVVIVHDDMELSRGDVDLVRGGSARGHNGVRSVEAVLGTDDFWRLRLGIGRPPEGVEASEFVLGKFGSEEQEDVAEMLSIVRDKLDGIT